MSSGPFSRDAAKMVTAKREDLTNQGFCKIL